MASMAENYTTYDAYNYYGNLQITASTIAVDAEKGEEYRVTLDKGDAYFDGDFSHTVDALHNPIERGAFWGLSNVADDFRDIDAANGYALWIGADQGVIRLVELHAGTPYSASWAGVASNTTYYYRITRNESVGTYGTLYAYVYSDSGRTNLLTTLSVTLHSKQDFRYVHGANSWRIQYVEDEYSALFANLDLGGPISISTSGAVEFPALTVEGAANTADKSAVGTPAFPSLASEGAVVLTHTGTGEPSFPLLTSEGEATPHWFFGPGEVTFPLLSSDGSVHVNPKHAVGAPEFPLLTASGTAIRPIRGAGAVTFPLLEADGGQIIKDTATGAAAFPAAIAAGAAKRKVTATGTPEFPLLEADTVAAKTITATGTPSLPAARAKGYSLDYDKHAGSGMPTLPAARASGRATLYSLRTATGAATLPAARAKGAGTDYDAFASTGTPALPAARAKGKAIVYRLRTATGAVTFRLLTADGTGTSKRIDGDATFGALTADGTAKRTVAATGAPEFPALTSSTSGQLVYTGTGDVTFGAALAEGAAGRTISASGTITFPALTADGTEYRIVYGEGAPEFEALQASTTTARTVYASGTPSFPVPYGGMHAFNATERALQWYRVVQIQYIGNEPYKRAKLEAVRAPVMR